MAFDQRSDVVRSVLAQLRERLGYPIEPVPPEMLPIGEASGELALDGVYEIRAEQEPIRLVIEAKDRALSGRDLRELESLAGRLLRSERRATLFLVSRKLLPRQRQTLREWGISHADLRGNIYLRAPGLVVDVEGASRGDTATAHESAFNPLVPPNPFHDRTSLLLRALLRSPNRPYRLADLAAETGVSMGWISRATREFVARGYAIRTAGGLRLGDAGQVLTEWSEEYSWQDNSIARFSVPFSSSEIEQELRGYLEKVSVQPAPSQALALTLHAGASLLAPHVRQDTVAIYVGDEAWNGVYHWSRSTLLAEPLTEGGNLQLVKSATPESALFDHRSVAGLPVVSPIQLYLDLRHYSVRGEEAAAVLARTVLRDELSLSREQIGLLTAE